jgi:hypothetical protein
VLQERPDLVGVAHTNRGDRGAGLPFRELVFGLLADHRAVPD